MNRFLLILQLLVAMPLVAVADDEGKVWIDVTEQYLRNVNMEDGFDAWNRTPARVDYQVAEFWNCDFDFFQTVELPAGVYRFSCEGFFRPTNTVQEAFDYHGESGRYAYIYAGDTEEPMLDITTAVIYQPNGCLNEVCDYDTWNFYYLPNSMEAARWCFENGYYHYSQVEFAKGDDGKIDLGLRCDFYTGGQWVIFDNFRLERLTSLVATESIAIAADKSELVPGETMQLTAMVTPANATYTSVLWSSSDEAVLTVDRDGVVTAAGIGTATITATARDNGAIKATYTITVKESVVAAGSLIINEVMSMNIDQILDGSFNYGGWIELYNPTDESISLRDCFITEDPDNLTEHRLVKATTIRSKGFYTIWFDHCDKYFPKQVDFKLSTAGDWIAIVSPKGEIMAEIEYPAGVQRCSWARTVDGGDEWGYTSQPTPGKSNANSKNWGEKQLAAPTVDVPGHFFTGTVSVQASWPEGSTLRYTTDGSAPTATKGKTSEDGKFEIEKTTNLRLAAVRDGWLPSAVTTNTYIESEYDFTIPVISVTAANADLYGAAYGIFVEGSGNGRIGNGKTTKCNWNQDWDRPAVFEYFTPDGERTFMQDVDICAAGGWSRAWEPHSFKLKAAKKYGLNSMDYPFFESKPYNKHKALQIRNGGNDNGCRFKDAAIQTIIQRSGIYIDGQAYQPVAHYINGQFIGVINMREPNNKHHGYSNYGLDTDFMDQFEISPDSGYVQKQGSKQSFLDMLELSKEAADPAVYKRICDEYLDIDEYINYMACWMWLGNSDWMRNNVKAYRSTEPGGRYHYVMFDTDGSFAYSGTNGFRQLETWAKNGAYSDGIYGGSVHLDFENCEMWMNLLQNDDFRKQFIDTYCLVAGSVFEPVRCMEILDELYDRVEPMMNLKTSYNGWWTSYESAYSTYSNLYGTFGNNSRNNTMINGVANYHMFYDETTAPKNITFSSDVPEATILYNGMDVPTGKFTGRAYMPVTLTACAPAGYDFRGWALKSAGGKVTKNVFSDGEDWTYYDQGSLDGVDWTATDYDASGWKTGTAPLGYDDGSSQNGVGSLLKTKISYGGYPSSKHPTYYFRKEFNLGSKPTDDDTYALAFTIDDGCIVYVNGQEVGRDNMPGGNVTFKSFASTYAQNNPNRGTMAIPASKLKKGRNVIAVEVHNNSASSSDICWDAAFSAIKTAEPGQEEFITTDVDIELDNEAIPAGAELVAYYTRHEPAATDKPTAPVRINEVSAANDIYANEYYKRNDWLELYNTTDEDIDVAGMYITDNANKPHKYQIPAQAESGISTIIPAHGYMMIWCDKLTDLTQLHASFKLSADEAMVMLTAADDSWFDYFNYPAHDRNYTAGRYPDGANDVYLLTRHTPGAANRMTSYAEMYELQSPDAITTPLSSVAGSLGLAFDGERIVASRKAHFEIYSPAGKMLMTAPATDAVSIGTLPQGIYIVRAKADGETAVAKFSKR